jgi:hypothetical protein
MKSSFVFTFDYIRDQFSKVIDLGYKPITCVQYIDYKKTESSHKVLVNRVDIDFSVKKTERLVKIFNELKIQATFFIRLHAPEYNPFSFENYRIIKFLIESGHELGYHSEIVDQAEIWKEEADLCLIRDIKVLNTMFGITVKGVASHGGSTGLNNLDFWRDKKAADFGLLYEAYDRQPEFNLFQESIYVSDSEWTRWKCYAKGELVKDDRQSLADHAQNGHQVLHSLIHPDTYFDRHIYEGEK